MSGNRWGPNGPPEEAYGRVTKPERFAPLHEVATELLDRLEREFDVGRSEGYGLDGELEDRVTLARPTVRLAPRHSDAAPVAVTFSAFPGLRVRFGHGCTRSFPACGCDACDETADGEVELLRWMTSNVIAGRLREAISVRADGTVWSEWETWSEDARSSQKSQLHGEVARRLLAETDGSQFTWVPWSRRR